ncbi:MAG TPA: hypothetical protein VEV62_00485 [Parafilimonas sp.]|nr:hypothetical protein [Parafilimonas sp.]
MSGRGDNKKHDSAQRESRNQNKQRLKAMQKHQSQNAEKRGGRTSAPRNKKKDEKMKLNADKDQE